MSNLKQKGNRDWCTSSVVTLVKYAVCLLINIARVTEAFEDPLCVNLNKNTGKRLIYEVFKYTYAFHGKEIEM